MDYIKFCDIFKCLKIAFMCIKAQPGIPRLLPIIFVQCLTSKLSPGAVLSIGCLLQLTSNAEAENLATSGMWIIPFHTVMGSAEITFGGGPLLLDMLLDPTGGGVSLFKSSGLRGPREEEILLWRSTPEPGKGGVFDRSLMRDK